MLTDPMFSCTDPLCGRQTRNRRARCCGDCGELLLHAAAELGLRLRALRTIQRHAAGDLHDHGPRVVQNAWDRLKDLTRPQLEEIMGGEFGGGFRLRKELIYMVQTAFYNYGITFFA